MSQNDHLQGKLNPDQKIVNDFCITFSTINGSGSATANNILLRALFRMGIPVSGKNIFPSNIQGLPTWYSIRLSKDGYLARLEKDDIVVAMNPATITKEFDFISPGGVLFYADDIVLPALREDITAYPMPVKKIVKESDISPTLRDYIANMVYVGVLSQMIGLKLEYIKQALNHHFKGKQKPIDANYNVIKMAADWAEANLQKKDHFYVEPMSGTDGYIMQDGNAASALGAIYGGVQFVGWYPITPATSLVESLNEFLPEFRKDPETGKDTCVVVQSEDELAAIGMSIGAGWGGLRSMTSTSGPGLSLMAEYLGLAYFAEIPVVVVDVQRVGPSTGLPTRTAQGDITFVNFIGHGDTDFIQLFPGSVNECFEHGWKAFDIAERLQTPVMVMTDLDLGMNQWMTKKFEFPETPIDRGKVLWEADIEKMEERINGPWGRYLDVDGDGIPYRTLIGNKNPKAAYLTRGTGHDEFARYSEEPDVWERVLARIKRKFTTAKDIVPKPVLLQNGGSKVGIIAYGSTDPAVIEARDQMMAAGQDIDYLRLKAVPFTDEVTQFIDAHDQIFIVEMNRDGQMNQLLKLEYSHCVDKFISLAFLDGLPLTARWIREQINAKEVK